METQLELILTITETNLTTDQFLKAGLAEQILYTGCRIDYLKEQIEKMKK